MLLLQSIQQNMLSQMQQVVLSHLQTAKGVPLHLDGLVGNLFESLNAGVGLSDIEKNICQYLEKNPGPVTFNQIAEVAHRVSKEFLKSLNSCLSLQPANQLTTIKEGDSKDKEQILAKTIEVSSSNQDALEFLPGKNTMSQTPVQQPVVVATPPPLKSKFQELSKEKKSPTSQPKVPTRAIDPKGILSSGELNPTFAKKLNEFLDDARSQGLNVFIFEGYRSPQEQQKIFESKSGVTQAPAGKSFHNYGLAADVIFYDAKGNPSWDAKFDWQKLGEIGKKHGLTWGGDFRSQKNDFGHFEFHPGFNILQVAEKFSKSGMAGVWAMVGG